jgi:T-complex protein 1 subunit theta
LLHGQEGLLAPLVAQACINVVPTNAENFNTDNVRVCKMLGGSLMDSTVIKGLVVLRLVEGAITHVDVLLNLKIRNAK